MPLGMAGIAASLDHPILLVLSALAFAGQLRACRCEAAEGSERGDIQRRPGVMALGLWPLWGVGPPA